MPDDDTDWYALSNGLYFVFPDGTVSDPDRDAMIEAERQAAEDAAMYANQAAIMEWLAFRGHRVEAILPGDLIAGTLSLPG